eukprot:6740959-Prymnesium_polylepis.5
MTRPVVRASRAHQRPRKARSPRDPRDLTSLGCLAYGWRSAPLDPSDQSAATSQSARAVCGRRQTSRSAPLGDTAAQARKSSILSPPSPP